METTTQTVEEFIAAHRLTMRAEPTDHNPHMADPDRRMDHWSVTIHHGRKRMSLVFSQGLAHIGPPELADVLDCLASDACSVEGFDFDEWAKSMGWDADSRKAERTYQAISQQMRQLGRLLGPDAYSDLLWNTERR